MLFWMAEADPLRTPNPDVRALLLHQLPSTCDAPLPVSVLETLSAPVIDFIDIKGRYVPLTKFLVNRLATPPFRGLQTATTEKRPLKAFSFGSHGKGLVRYFIRAVKEHPGTTYCIYGFVSTARGRQR